MDESDSTETELDLEDVGGTLPAVIVGILAALGVALLGVPLLGLGWTQAVVVGAGAGIVAAVAAALGSRHATPE